MKIYIGSDHGGFYLKEKIEAYLSKRCIELEDVGDKELDPHDDFPQFAQMAATKLLGEDEKTDPDFTCDSHKFYTHVGLIFKYASIT